MKLGIAIAGDNALPSAFVILRGLEKSIRQAAEYGYDGVELALKDPNEVDKAALRKLLNETGMEISAISTGQVFAERGLMFTKEDPAKRAELEKIFKGFIDLASEFSGLVNIGRVRGFIKGRDKAMCEDLFVEMARKLCDYAAPKGVKLILEPVNRYEIDFINSVDEGMALMKKVDRPNMALQPDVFHMNIEDDNIGQSLIRNRDYVAYVHLADSNRHAPGDGHLDFDNVFASLAKIKFDGWVTVECLPLPSDIEAATRAVKFIRKNYLD